MTELELSIALAIVTALALVGCSIAQLVILRRQTKITAQLNTLRHAIGFVAAGGARMARPASRAEAMAQGFSRPPAPIAPIGRARGSIVAMVDGLQRTIAHDPTCPVMQPGFKLTYGSVTDQITGETRYFDLDGKELPEKPASVCDCDFAERLKAELGVYD